MWNIKALRRWLVKGSTRRKFKEVCPKTAWAEVDPRDGPPPTFNAPDPTTRWAALKPQIHDPESPDGGKRELFSTVRCLVCRAECYHLTALFLVLPCSRMTLEKLGAGIARKTVVARGPDHLDHLR